MTIRRWLRLLPDGKTALTARGREALREWLTRRFGFRGRLRRATAEVVTDAGGSTEGLRA